MEYKFATLDEATATAMTVVGAANDEDRLRFRQWVWEGLKLIGPTNQWMKVCRLEKKDGSFKKPTDHSDTIDVALYDSSDQQVRYIFNTGVTRIHQPQWEIQDNTSGSTLVGRVDLSEDANYFHMGSNSSIVEYALLRYYALPIDRNGELLVPEDNIFPLAMFCRWMWSMRKDENQSQIMNNRDTWYREMDRVKGKNKMPSHFRAKEFLKKYMSLVNSYKPDQF